MISQEEWYNHILIHSMILVFNMEVPSMLKDSYLDHTAILEIETLINRKRYLCSSLKAFRKATNIFLSLLDKTIKILVLKFKNKTIEIMKFKKINRICTKMKIIYRCL